jgi:hypothetical protein
MTKLAVAFDVPGAYFLMTARLLHGMGKGTRRSRGAGANFEEFTGYMGEIFY